MNVTSLYCSSCNKHHAPRQLYDLCDCGKPLMVADELDRAACTRTFPTFTLSSSFPFWHCS